MSNSRQLVFGYLASCESMIKVSLGMVTPGGFVDLNYVVIHEAPPRVVREVVSQMKMISLTEAGLVIPLNKPNED